MNPRKALAEWLDQRAAARAAQKRAPLPPSGPTVQMAPALAEMIMRGSPTEGAPLITDLPETAAVVAEAPAAREPATEPNAEIRSILEQALSARNAIEAAEVPAEREPMVPASNARPESVEINAEVIDLLEQERPAVHRSFAELWNSIEAPVLAPKRKPAAPPKLELIRGAGTPGEFALPPGMNDASDVRHAIAAGKRFSGFAIAIGVSDNQGCPSSDQDLLRSIGIFIRSLLRESEFACRYAPDQFLVLCPNREGAEAQRRLTAISEQLWDYQLRNASRFSLVFTWGSSEAHHESLAEAIASATDRMNETRRTRRVVSVDMLRSQPRAAAI